MCEFAKRLQQKNTIIQELIKRFLTTTQTENAERTQATAQTQEAVEIDHDDDTIQITKKQLSRKNQAIQEQEKYNR